MTNKETGVYYVHRSKLFASGIYGLGTILLCKDGNEYRVHFLRRDSRELMEDVYATEVEPLVNPTKVAFIKPLNRFLPELKEIMIFCDNEDGGGCIGSDHFYQNGFVSGESKCGGYRCHNAEISFSEF